MKRILTIILSIFMAIGLFMPVFADDGRGMALDDMTYKTFMGGTMADLTKEMTDPSQGSGEMINHSDGDELTYFGKLLIVDNFRIDETNIPDDKLLLTTEMNYVGDYKNQKNIVVSRSKLYLKKVDENYVVSSDLSNDTVTLDTNKTSNPYNAHTFVYVYDGDGSNNGNVQLSSWIEVYSNGVLQGTIHLDKERLNSYNNDVNEKKVIITGFDDFKVNFTLSLISGRGDSEATLNDLVDVSSVSKAIALAENNDIIRLTKDINEKITVDKNIILDINGYDVNEIEGSANFVLIDSRARGHVDKVSMLNDSKVALQNVTPNEINDSSIDSNTEIDFMERGVYTLDKWRVGVSDGEYKKIQDVFDKIIKTITDNEPYTDEIAKYISEDTYNGIVENYEDWEIRCLVESSSDYDKDDDRKIKDRYKNKVLHTTDISINIKALYKRDQEMASGDDTFTIGKMYAVDDPFEIEIEVPEEEKRNGRKFSIVRMHNGEMEVLADGINYDKNGMISFETDSFSTYAVLYEDQTGEEIEEPIAPTPDEPTIEVPSNRPSSPSYSDTVDISMPNNLNYDIPESTMKGLDSTLDDILDMVDDRKDISTSIMSEETLNALKEAINDDKDISIELSLSNLTPTSDQRLVRKYFDDVLRFFDLSVYLLADGERIGIITSLQEKIEVEVTEIEEADDLYVYRVHDGKLEFVDELVDSDNDGILEFFTDKFSKYAIIKGARPTIVVETSAR